MLPALLKNLACSTIVTLPGQKGLNASIEWLKLRSLEVLYTIYSSTGFSNLLDWSWPATALLYSLSYLFVQHSQTRSKQHQNSLKCLNSISKNKLAKILHSKLFNKSPICRMKCLCTNLYSLIFQNNLYSLIFAHFFPTKIPTNVWKGGKFYEFWKSSNFENLRILKVYEFWKSTNFEH